MSGRPLIPWTLVVGLLLSGAARAEGISEFWPELNYFYRVNPQARVFLDAAHAKGKESDERSLDLAAYLDLSFKPNLMGKLRTDDWQRSRSFWARIGYDRIFNVTDESGREVAENRGIVAVHGKAPLPADVWLEARARADLRWIGDEYSTRYRARLEATARVHGARPYGRALCQLRVVLRHALRRLGQDARHCRRRGHAERTLPPRDVRGEPGRRAPAGGDRSGHWGWSRSGTTDPTRRAPRRTAPPGTTPDEPIRRILDPWSPRPCAISRVSGPSHSSSPATDSHRW